MWKIEIRNERQEDESDISELIRLAFENDPISDKRESEIVRLMRNDSALSISLVAVIDNVVVGHISFSKVNINNEYTGWYGLAPVAVLPKHQNAGIGSKLILEGLGQLNELDAKGCVLLGEPGYYKRFGFKPHSELILEGVPPEYFQALSLGTGIPSGVVKYHAAFG